MAVQRGRNGMMGEEEDEGGLFEEDFEFDEEEEEPDSHIPLHLRQIFNAVECGDVDALRQALDDFNGSIDEPLEDGDTALHIASLYGHLSCVELLLERGASVEAKDEDGAIPLHDACAGGYTEIARLLINNAPDSECVKRMMDTFDEEGDAPLHHAARGEHLDVIRLLIASGASACRTNLLGRTPYELVEPESEAYRLLDEAICAELGRPYKGRS
ncbi:uncharacterized protein LOC132629978 [Lycium barbarum]|uniref:uncharacterized protein LOC132629978 n=1 Tax=Lycium barbarum TaxID=112863 RepID=UPI00293EC8CD|nr:uncharacterized protein LOC132629978 [Lycium barbarum]